MLSRVSAVLNILSRKYSPFRARSKEKTIAALEALLSEESGNEIKKQSTGVKTGVLLRAKKILCFFLYHAEKYCVFISFMLQ